MSETESLVKALECLLFAAKEPVAIPRLAEVMAVEATELPRLLAELETSLGGHGLHLVKLAGGYSLATRPEFADHVHRLLEPDPERLSLQALETLAIIAYRQPITRPEIEDVRGVNSSGSVASLLEKDLIRIAGRRDAAGRPFLFETTAHFLSVFGLSDLSDLPDIGELRRRMDAQVILVDEESAAEAQDAAQEMPTDGEAPDMALPGEGRDPESAPAAEDADSQ